MLCTVEFCTTEYAKERTSKFLFHIFANLHFLTNHLQEMTSQCWLADGTTWMRSIKPLFLATAAIFLSASRLKCSEPAHVGSHRRVFEGPCDIQESSGSIIETPWAPFLDHGRDIAPLLTQILQLITDYPLTAKLPEGILFSLYDKPICLVARTIRNPPPPSPLPSVLLPFIIWEGCKAKRNRFHLVHPGPVSLKRSYFYGHGWSFHLAMWCYLFLL